MSAKFKQVIYAGQKLVDESGGGGGNYQEKSVSFTPTESQQTEQVTPGSGYDALSKVNVTVDAIDSEYVGSAIDRRDSTDLSQSGATVTAPAGYYENDATKTLDEQAAQTIHPSTTDQTIASGKYLTGAQTIKAVTTNITADKIVSGFTAEIGDASDSDCVASIVGTASGGGLEEKEVTFYDYDGTILFAYTTEEFLALESMPTAPGDTELATSGWNWSFADAKTWVTKYGMLAIGNMRYPADGSTRIIVKPKSGETLTVGMSGTYSGTIAWGDNTTDTLASSVSHTYANGGDYVIRITTSTGNAYEMSVSSNIDMIDEVNLGLHATNQLSTGRNFGGNCRLLSLPKGLTTIKQNSMGGSPKIQAIVFPDTLTSLQSSNYPSAKVVSLPNFVPDNIPFCPQVRMITTRSAAFNVGVELSVCKFAVIGDDATATSSAQRWKSMRSLEKVYISSNLASIHTENFLGLYKLKKLAVPASLTSMGGDFTDLYSLEELTFPNNIALATLSGFTNIYNLTELTIPASVTTIQNNVFSNAQSLRELHFKPTSPPSVGGTGALGSLNSTCVIYVPYSADHSVLAAYQAATNLSRYSSQMVEESA